MLERVKTLGRIVSDGVRGVGDGMLLLFQCVGWMVKGFPDKREIVRQFYFIGVQSLPVILTTGAFVGAVLAYTSYNQFVALGNKS